MQINQKILKTEHTLDIKHKFKLINWCIVYLNVVAPRNAHVEKHDSSKLSLKHKNDKNTN